ncbi:MAG: protein-glutamate O-methyltransferase CheR [Myxococcota bacterium]
MDAAAAAPALGPAPMPERVQRRLRELTYEHTGIVIGPDKETLLVARVQKRMRKLGLASYEAYIQHFDAHPDELQQFINVITTNTTAFWREADHFDLAREQLTAWAEDGQRRFRIWCAASSTGEEPWTIGLTLSPVADQHGLDLLVLATDIDTRVLGVAKRAVYTREAVRAVPPDVRARGFEPVPEGLRVVRAVRERVRFGQLNLTRPPFPMKGPLDLIFCRNVMIYLDRPTRQRLIAECVRLLRPGGLLILGHSESALGMTDRLEVVRPSVYRVPE